jgi:hypothetical protein
VVSRYDHVLEAPLHTVPRLGGGNLPKLDPSAPSAHPALGAGTSFYWPHEDGSLGVAGCRNRLRRPGLLLRADRADRAFQEERWF